MVQLRRYKGKHRSKTIYRKPALQDLYTALHYIAHTSRLNPAIKRLAVFSVRVLAPRPALRNYTKGVKNSGTTNERIDL